MEHFNAKIVCRDGFQSLDDTLIHDLAFGAIINFVMHIMLLVSTHEI